MESCEGNWDSEVKWEKQAGLDVAKEYETDGSLHICPQMEPKIIRGQQTVTIDVEAKVTGTYPLLQGSTCVPDGVGRFKIDYKREGADGETYRYEGRGRRMLTYGPAFIRGTVTVTVEGGAKHVGDTGTWEAVRVGRHDGGPGGGEGPAATASEATTGPTGHP
jgi:hypothetical protein